MENNRIYNANEPIKDYLGSRPVNPYFPARYNWHTYLEPSLETRYCSTAGINSGFSNAAHSHDGARNHLLPSPETSYWNSQLIGSTSASPIAVLPTQSNFHASSTLRPPRTQAYAGQKASQATSNWTGSLPEDLLESGLGAEWELPSFTDELEDKTLPDFLKKDESSDGKALHDHLPYAENWLTPEGLAAVTGDDSLYKAHQPQATAEPEPSTEPMVAADYTFMWDDLDNMRFGPAGYIDPFDKNSVQPTSPTSNTAPVPAFDLPIDPAIDEPKNKEQLDLRESRDAPQPPATSLNGLDLASLLAMDTDMAADDTARVHRPHSPEPLIRSAVPQLTQYEHIQPPALTGMAKDNFLLQCKAQGMTYKVIKRIGGFKEAESTLRGRYRALTKTKEERVRKPTWNTFAIDCLKRAVGQHLREIPGLVGPDPSRPGSSVPLRTRDLLRAMTKVPWKQVADEMHGHGCYRYGNSTVKKKFMEVMRLRPKS